MRSRYWKSCAAGFVALGVALYGGNGMYAEASSTSAKKNKKVAFYPSSKTSLSKLGLTRSALESIPLGGLFMLNIDEYHPKEVPTYADKELDRSHGVSFFKRRRTPGMNLEPLLGVPHVLEYLRGYKHFPKIVEAFFQMPDRIGQLILDRPDLVDKLEKIKSFKGTVEALPEGTLLSSGPAISHDGTPLMFGDKPFKVFMPAFQLDTSVLFGALTETPILTRMNSISRLGANALRIVMAAAGKPVAEFGQRQSEPLASINASYAAYASGAAWTSNVLASVAYGIPLGGTVRHLRILNEEQPGVSIDETEARAYDHIDDVYPGISQLPDTYDFVKGTGIIVKMVERKRPDQVGIPVRNDSSETTKQIRQLYKQLVKNTGRRDIYFTITNELTAERIAELTKLPYVKGFGVGENFSQPMMPAFGGAAKVIRSMWGQNTMKISSSGKATLPALQQIYELPNNKGYLLALKDEDIKTDGTPMLKTIWQGTHEVGQQPSIDEVRDHIAAQVAKVDPRLRKLAVAADSAFPKFHLSRGMEAAIKEGLKRTGHLQ